MKKRSKLETKENRLSSKFSKIEITKDGKRFKIQYLKSCSAGNKREKLESRKMKLKLRKKNRRMRFKDFLTMIIF